MDKTLVKGLNLLEELAKSRDPKGVAELARTLGWSKSNVHRLLQTLVECGYVSSEGGRYWAGLKLWSLGSRVVARTDVRQAAQPFLEKLAQASQETVHLSILERYEVVYVDKIDSPQPIRAYSEIGGRAPAYCVATGKAMLAFQPPEVIEQLSGHLVRHSPNTITDPERLAAEFATIRTNGYSVNQGEWRQQVSGIGAPIRDSSGNVVAALGISGPSERFTKSALRKLAPLVCQAAENVSSNLGAPHRQGDIP